MFLVIDNYDSFTYNLVQYLGELSVDHDITKELLVKRNDEITLEEISHINPDGILLSPGPGNPDQSGICLPILQNLSKEIPIFVATRYHSLIVDSESLPSCFDITATLEDSTIMAISHKEYKNLHGVQFHPESVLTQFGHKLISNFLNMAEQK